MNFLKKLISSYLAPVILIPVLILNSCSDDSSNKDTNDLTGIKKVYTISAIGNSGISGTVTFEELTNNGTRVTIDLNGTIGGSEHPAHIHLNTAAETGAIAISLTSIDGGTGMSVTDVTQQDNSTPVTYDDLIEFNGYINVHSSPTDLVTIVSQVDIGQNELTGNTISYDMIQVDASGIDGTAEFAERVNGTTLVTVQLSGTMDNDVHPMHIHDGNVNGGSGAVAITLTSLDGTTGKSQTQIAEKDDGTDITYTELLAYDGYINVHLSPGNLGVIVAQGNIGSNLGGGALKDFVVTNNGASSYIFNGGGLNNEEDPVLTLKRGETYTFDINAAGHPFWFKTVQGTGASDAYNDGITNNGVDLGLITFTVPANAPDTLFYNCEIHSSMTNTINIID